MPLVHSTQYGATYKWGFQAADAPAITGMSPRSADISYEPEVVSKATNGEGHVDSRTQSNADKRRCSGTITGYVDDSWDPAALANHFSWLTRTFFITNISEPRRKGDYWECSLSVESDVLVTA